MGKGKEKDQQRPQNGDMGAFPTRSLPDSSEELGTEIGRYKLLSVLGEGGFGIVYLAEQKQPVRRQVALKVIKPGMDSKQVIARFEAERQALALLDHPNIARVFDAGATEKGRPYFVMEIVRGLPITEYCDHHNLSIEERLELFRQVCGAVQHAHYKGIIHRDLKPSNILVPVRGDKPVPMIIDFGVAKAISQPLTERTLFTEQGQFIGTPEYMSPEQAGITIEDIDTRSDIYSLGIVLYELLTGTLPFSRHELEHAGFAEIQRIIRETDPPRPSTRLSGLGEDATKIAEKRHTEVRALTKRLHNELEWIPLKAMRKDPDRRYTSATELADDVQNYLNGDPLIAGPESSAYRAKKFVRKHRAKLIYAGLVLMMLVLAVALIRGELQRREEGKEILKKEQALVAYKRKLEAKRQLSVAEELYAGGRYGEALSKIETLLENEPAEPNAQLIYAKLLFELDRSKDAVAEIEKLLDEPPEIAGAAHNLLARIYMGRDRAKSIEHQKKCEELLPESPEAYWLRAATSGTFGEGVQWLEKALHLDPAHYPSHRALALTYYAVRDFKSMEQEAYVMTTMRKNDPQCYSLMAIALRESGSPTDAVGYHDKAIEISPDDSGLYDQRRQTYMRMGDYEKALSDAETCIRLQPREAIHRFHRFCALVGLRRYDEAKAKYKEVFGSGSANREYFQNESMKYVFDALSTGQKLNLPDSGSQDAAFWPMYQACVFYRELEAKAKPTQGRGWQVSWSPDGRELAYSRDLTKSLCVEILNTESRKSRVLTAPGKDPSWSTDGQYIAFVREGQYGTFDTIIVGTEAESRGQVEEEEVWLIRPTGEDLKFLCKGGYPSWSSDSKRVYFHSRQDFYLYSVSIENGNAQPQRVIHCPSTYYPVISPDEKHVAYVWKYPERNVLVIAQLPPASSVWYWEVPMNRGWDFIAWSPDGQELSVGGYGDVGLWIYDMNTRTGSNVLGGQVVRGAWSPDGSRMALELRAPTDYIWIADLKPGLSTAEALGPSRTIDEHREYLMRRWESALAAGALGPDFSEGDLVAWWAFNEASGKVVPDYAGNGLNARLMGTASIVEDHIRGNVLSLDGNGYVHCDCGRDSAFQITGAVTVAAWIKVNEFNKQWQAIVTKGDNAWRLQRRSETGAVEYACTGANVQGDNYGCLQGSATIDDGKWHHIAGVYDGKNVCLYVDGAVDVSKKAWGFVNTNNFPLLIGANAEKEGRNWDGLIDDVQIYSRALSEEEVRTLYETEKSGTTTSLGVAPANSQAWLPQPSDGAHNVTVSPDLELTWIPGADVVEQRVYFGTDAKRLALLQTLERENSIELPELSKGQDYFWRVDAKRADGSPITGDLWTFSTGGMIVGWWEFDEVEGQPVSDSCGFNNDGKLVGNPRRVPGRIGKAIELDGVDDYVDCGNDPSLDITGAVTLSAWIRLSGKADDQKVAGNQDDNAGGYKMSVYSNKVDFEIKDQSNVPTLNRNVAGGTILQPGVWYHVAGVYSEGNYIRTYVNGNLDRELATGAVLANTSGTLKIGREPYDATYGFLGFRGLIDDVRIYNYALNGNEIRAAFSEIESMRASVPSPYNRERLGRKERTVGLSWKPAKNAVEYKVYFGIDATNLSFLRSVGTAVSVQSPELHALQDYFWRVDVKRSDGSEEQGDLWMFSTVGLVGWWKFDETEGDTAADSSGHNNHARLVGDARRASGRIDKAIELDGVDDYVSVPPLNLYTNSLTITAWIKRDSVQKTNSGVVLCRDQSTIAGFRIKLDEKETGKNYISYIWNNDPDSLEWKSGIFVPDNKWVYVALVVEPTKATLYLGEDGELSSATNVINHDLEEFDGVTYIGRDTYTADRHFPGCIDDVRIYNYALSEAEIRDLYEETAQTPNTSEPMGKPDHESPAQINVPSTETVARLQSMLPCRQLSLATISRQKPISRFESVTSVGRKLRLVTLNLHKSLELKALTVICSVKLLQSPSTAQERK